MVAAFVGAGHPAGADVGEADGEETPGGFSAYVIDWEGDVDLSRTAGVSLPPPVCWWGRPDLAADPTDAGAWREAYTAHVAAAPVWDEGYRRIARLPGGMDALDRAHEADQVGLGIRWWQLRYDHAQLRDVDFTGELVERGCTEASSHQSVPAIVEYRYRPVTEVPPPVVDVESLARYAYVALDLVLPTLEWNPRISAQGGATMVNLPTWMWVERGAALEQRSLRARVRGTDLWVEVVAEPQSLVVSSPDGGVSKRCTPSEGRRSFAVGRDDASACLVTFLRESATGGDGFQLRAQTTWRATWRASTGADGTFDLMTITAETPIRVASTQSLVVDVR
ncbi:hypothetical protein [Nocardioides daphniae]|uniref:Secreted protein n=1 Tax=Nocardioides daphniae TaxID=402297 RepID=A0A4P7UEF4_9ACTN|nr:hypothetical protein [Nocardioides daphniae]QCC77911.1 hypothetical protein E2C04_13285 [Nocardioides daphniae]